MTPNPQYSLSEFRPVECAGCGSTRRRLVAFGIDLQHRLKSSLVVTATKQIGICAGCGVQVQTSGAPTPADDPDFLNLRERANLCK